MSNSMPTIHVPHNMYFENGKLNEDAVAVARSGFCQTISFENASETLLPEGYDGPVTTTTAVLTTTIDNKRMLLRADDNGWIQVGECDDECDCECTCWDDEEELISVAEFKSWLHGLIKEKGGALPDIHDWKEIKAVLDTVYDDTEDCGCCVCECNDEDETGDVDDDYETGNGETPPNGVVTISCNGTSPIHWDNLKIGDGISIKGIPESNDSNGIYEVTSSKLEDIGNDVTTGATWISHVSNGNVTLHNGGVAVLTTTGEGIEIEGEVPEEFISHFEHEFYGAMNYSFDFD